MATFNNKINLINLELIKYCFFNKNEIKKKTLIEANKMKIEFFSEINEPSEEDKKRNNKAIKEIMNIIKKMIVTSSKIFCNFIEIFIEEINFNKYVKNNINLTKFVSDFKFKFTSEFKSNEYEKKNW